MRTHKVAVALAIAVVGIVATLPGASAQTLMWRRQFGTPHWDEAAAVAVDATGVYVTGYTSGSLGGQPHVGGHDVFVRRYTLAGRIVWTREFSSYGRHLSETYDEGLAIALDSTGVYVGGRVEDGALPGFTKTVGESGFIRKFDLDGNELWTTQIDIYANDAIDSLAVDATGVYAAGMVGGGAFPGYKRTQASAFVQRYQLDGTLMWTRQFGADTYTVAAGVGSDRSGVYVAGSTYGALPHQLSGGAEDAFVRKYNHRGGTVWTRQYGTASADVANAISVVGGLAYVTGFTYGGPQYVTAFGRDGGSLWTTDLPTDQTVSTWPTGIVAGSHGILVTGWTRGGFPDQTNFGGNDAFISHLRSDGTFGWVRVFGTPQDDEGLSVAVGGPASYVAGWTEGVFPGSTGAGWRDAFLTAFSTN